MKGSICHIPVTEVDIPVTEVDVNLNMSMRPADSKVKKQVRI